MRSSLFLAPLCAVLLLAGCATSGAPAAEAPAAEAPVQAPAQAPALPAMTPAGSLTLFQGGCFYYSSCETTELTIRPDGGYTLSRQEPGPLGPGPRPTPVITTGQLAPGAFAAAERVLVEGEFAALPEQLNSSTKGAWGPDAEPCMNHAPGVRITRRTGDGAERQVFWDLGCRSAKMTAFVAALRTAIGPTN